jgi:hypothetical protein
LILAALLIGMGFFLGTSGLVADLIRVNRMVLETVNHLLRQLQERRLEKCASVALG